MSPGQVAATLLKRAPDMTRVHLPGIIAMAIIVVASNILVQFLFGNWLTWGAFTYPLAFLVTDIMNRVYGAGPARTVVFVGFIVGVFCSLIGTQIMLQGDGFTYPAVTFRIAIGSGLAFLTAQLLDVGVFSALRKGVWWKAPLASTIIGSSVDTAIFFTIAFSASLTWLEPANDVSWAGEILPLLGAGPEAPLWVSLAVADWMVKLSLALIALAPFRWVTARATSAS
ncbi:membrane protein [Tateyamaria omphalii]|nr:membrane protein [Tateyamaria omphalii]